MTTTASPTGRPLKPRARSIATVVAIPTAAPPRSDHGERRRRERDARRKEVGETGKRGHERRPVGREVEERREPEHDEPLPRQLVDLVPDVPVVRDARQRESEHGADDSDGDNGADDSRASRAALPARLVELGADELVFGRGNARVDPADGTLTGSPSFKWSVAVTSVRTGCPRVPRRLP